MALTRLSRRMFLNTTATGASRGFAPRALRAQPATFQLGVIHPVTGPLAEPGQACRLGAQMAADAINAAGGIKSLGGMKLELLLGDTQTKPDLGRLEAERVVNQGARMLMGSFDSGSTAAMVSVAQQKRVPFLVDIAAADPITANVAKAVKDGQQKVQYVYRNFPTGSSFGRLAVRYFNEIFTAARVAPRRVVLMYTNDLFGQNQSKGFIAAHKAASPSWEIVEVIPWSEPPSDLSTEVSRAKAAKPDVIAPITRPASAQLLLPEIRKQRVEVMGIVGPGSPGLYEAGQLAALKDDLEYVMDNVPSWPNFKKARTQAVAEEYRKRSGGKTFDTNSVASYDGMLTIADVLTLIFGVMRVVNFAHGDMMVWGMYVTFLLASRAGVDPYVAFGAAAAALFVLGLAVQRGLVDRVLDAPHEMQILLMLGVALILENTALLAFGPEPTRARSTLAAATIWLGPVFVDVPRRLACGVALLLPAALGLFLFRTELGRLMRATADNTFGALVIGTDVRRVYAVAFGVGAACVGAAGALVAPILPWEPATGLSLSVASFNIVIIGGMGSLLGAFVGGLLVSVAESLGAVFLQPSLKELASFSLLILILLFRPAGLFGNGRDG